MSRPDFPTGAHADTDAHRERWRLSVLAAMKALSLDDPMTPAVAFYARVFFRSDIPTRDSL